MKLLYFGIFLLLTALGLAFSPEQQLVFVVVYGVVFSLGLIFIYDGIVFRLKHRSLLQGTDGFTQVHLLLAGAAGGLIIEAMCNWLFKLWIYPYFPAILYILFVLPLLSLYFFLLLENYQAVVALIELRGWKQRTFRNFRWYGVLFPLLGMVGVVGFVMVTWIELSGYIVPATLLSIFNTYWYVKNNLFLLFILPISFFCILESLEWWRREDSFLLHLLEGDWVPLVAILVGSLVTSLAMELLNVPVKVWEYTNWPYQDAYFLGVPIVILVFWPFQYLLFVSMYRVLFRKDTARVWDSSQITLDN